MAGTSEISGNVLDWNGDPVQNTYVEAYHVLTLGGLEPTFPFYYLGISEETNLDGEFKIRFPADASIKYSNSVLPNIFLRITDQSRIIHQTTVIDWVNDLSSTFEVNIPSKFVYSNEIDHVNWEQVLESLVESSGKSIEDIMKTIPGFVQPILDSIYLTEIVQKKLKYRGINVPNIPKKQPHEHTIPWYSDWSENT